MNNDPAYYRLLYYLYYMPPNGVTANRLEIYTYSQNPVAAQEIKGATPAFIVELPKLTSLFQIVRGTGATIKLLSDTDRRFFNTLYTSDPFGLMVKHYVGGSLDWLGYLNSEMYQEPYSYATNYPIQVLANNGLGLLSRLSFVQVDGSFYSGLKSEYELLKICLDKIALPWSEVRISLSTTFEGQAVENTSLGAPTGLLVSNSSGALAAGDYYYEVTAYDANGETAPASASKTSTGTGGFIISWTAVAGAVGYRVYGRTATGTQLLEDTTGTLVLDDGSKTPSGIISYLGSILHQSLLNCANFYDEDPKPMNLREVIETVLGPYGAKLNIKKGMIYITDVNTQGGGADVTYSRYDYTTGVYLGTVTEPAGSAIVDIGYHGTDNDIENSGGYNKQVIDYSPYAQSSLVPESVKDEAEFTTIPDAYTLTNGYYIRTLDNNTLWIVTAPAVFEQSYYTDTPQLYLKWEPQPVSQKVVSLKVNPFVSYTMAFGINSDPAGYLAIKVSGKVLIKTKDNPYNDGLTSASFYGVGLNIKVKIGDKYYYRKYRYAPPGGYTSEEWDAANIDQVNQARATDSGNVVSDKFVDFTFYALVRAVLPEDVGGLIYGGLDVEIWSDVQGCTDYYKGTYVNNPAAIREVWVKDLAVKATMGDGSDLNNADIEYIGLLDPNFQNEGKKVTLKSGSDVYLADNAKIMYRDTLGAVAVIKTWTRAGQSFRIEELLLNSYISNYKTGSYKLNNVTLNNNLDIWGVVTDALLPGKIFIVEEAEVDYWEGEVRCTLAEIQADQLTIIL